MVTLEERSWNAHDFGKVSRFVESRVRDDNPVWTNRAYSGSGTGAAAELLGQITIPANTMEVGDLVRICAGGHYVVGGGSATHNMRVRISETADDTSGNPLFDTGSFDPADEDYWSVDMNGVILSLLGLSAISIFDQWMSGPLGPVGLGAATRVVVDTDTQAIDLTAAQHIKVVSDWSGGSEEVNLRMFSLEIRKPIGSTSNMLE